MNDQQIVEIIQTKIENKNIKTLFFEFSKRINPGQFFMILIPKVDEIPMSVSYIKKNIKGITFRKVGEATNSLFDLKDGDRIGVRGPYGNYFNINGKKILFVGGGTGIATLAPAVEEAEKKKISSHIVIGAKNSNELFFEDRFKGNLSKLYVTTDDGSKGYKGHAFNLSKVLMNKHIFSSILTCGPEIMMKKLLDFCEKTPIQACLERYMKCGVGICGNCCIGKGLRVCKEGPVFEGNILRNLEDFGVYRRDASGIKLKF